MSDNKGTINIISHTHWDREWYMNFEQHRIRLVDFMDKLIETLENDEDFKSFHLDGQSIVIEDYLEVKPEMKERIKKLVAADKLIIGPWYILQDEFLTSGESNVRNMLYGIKETEKFGKVCMVGYFPDAFGNISQAPQILNGFEIDNVAFGRGITAVGMDNQALGDAESTGFKSEVLWKSPDGSEVVGVLFANWYNNGSEIPENTEEAVEFIKERKKNAANFAATPHVLLMNGCDHQPVQCNVGKIIKKVQPFFDEDTVIHNNFNKYFEMVREYKDKFKSVTGELTGQKTDGWWNLVNTASSRIYMKQKNYEVQRDLEKWAEPLSSMAYLLGGEYRQDLLYLAWKYLMQNHPHDSICGCSVDDVHEEMMIRYKKSHSIINEVIKRSLEFVAEAVDTSETDEGDIPIVIFNPLGFKASGYFTVNIDLDENDKQDINNFRLLDQFNNEISMEIEDLGLTKVFSLPDDSFRKVWTVRRLRISAYADNLPSMGYATFKLSSGTPAALESKLSCSDTSAENEYIRIDIKEDGSIKLLNKRNGRVYENLNIIEDSGDVGNEYNYRIPKKDKTITTKGVKANIELYKHNNDFVTFKIKHVMSVPAYSDIHESCRSDELTNMIVKTYVTVWAKSPRVDVKTVFNNVAKDHRVRALFPTEIKSDYCYADGQYDLVKREIKPWEGWSNPSNCEREQAFVEVCDTKNGLLIANKGLPEYEVLRDGQNTIAITLLRAVGEVGDWFYFPTPEAQCQIKSITEYSIVAYCGDEEREDAHKQGYLYNLSGLKAVQTSRHNGERPLQHSFVNVKSSYSHISAFKKTEDRDSFILRLYNPGETGENIEIELDDKFKRCYRTLLSEKRVGDVAVAENKLMLEMPAKKIVTIELE